MNLAIERVRNVCLVLKSFIHRRMFLCALFLSTITLAALATMGLAASLPAFAQMPITNFAVFGASGVQANVGTATGLIGSNGDLSPGLFCHRSRPALAGAI